MKRLRADSSGNVLVIVATMLPPLIVLVGGAIDMSRAYLAKESLQAACDAGVLAGRRAMSKSGSYSATEKARADKMFAFNFQARAVDAGSTSFTTASTSTGEVTGTASASVPTTVTRIIGNQTFAVAVTCSAELQMASADVMFVLDTTGSMNCSPGVTCTSSTEASDAKIKGLRSAVRNFYTTVANAVTDRANTRIRFGFVPYGMTVNIKDLVTAGDIPASYLAASNTYQTKLFYFANPTYVGTPGAPVATVETYGSAILQSDCNLYATNDYPSAGANPVNAGSAPANTTQTTYSYNNWTKTQGNGTNAKGTCKRNASTVTTTYVTKYKFSYYSYVPATLSTTGLSGGSAVSLATAADTNTSIVGTQGTYDMRTLAGMGVAGVTTANSTWGGCIEERATVRDAAMDPVPAGATDLDINAAPTSEATRWKPYWGDVEVYRYNYLTGVNSTTNLGGSIEYCPAPIKKFTDVDISSPNNVPSWLGDYLDGLVARGGTYHDIGMVWGGRIGSPRGIMASNVNAGGIQPTRHVIFMTDGIMEPSLGAYSAYGMEMYDNRVAPAGTDQATLTNYHNARFLAACNAVKAEGYIVWLIGFGVTLTDQMKACASGDRAYFASDTTELNNTFRFIAGQVADLRLKR